MKTTITSLLISASSLSTSYATTIYVEAESGSYGANYTSTAHSLALGNAYLSSNLALGGNSPVGAAQVIDYQVALSVGTYDLYVRGYIETPSPGNNDSIFVGNGFGAKALSNDAEWTALNNMQSLQSPEGTTLGTDNYVWINFTTKTDVSQFTTTGGTETFQLAHREDGFRIDAFAFVTSGETPSSAQLSANAVPEPSSLALIGLGAVGALLRRNRR